MADPVCSALRIPEHLHREERELVPDFAPSEVLFRRFKMKPSEQTIFECISLYQEVRNPDGTKRKLFEMSTNRRGRNGELSTAEDALINTDTGERRDGYGVLPLRADYFPGEVLEYEDRRFVVEVRHAPERCNYAHSNVVSLEIDKEGRRTPAKLPGPLMLALRERIEADARIELPAERRGQRLKLKN